MLHCCHGAKKRSVSYHAFQNVSPAELTRNGNERKKKSERENKQQTSREKGATRVYVFFTCLDLNPPRKMAEILAWLSHGG